MFVIGGRVALALPEPWSAVRCEVDSIDSEPLQQLVAHRLGKYIEAADVAAQIETRDALAKTLVVEGRLVWDLVNAKGPIPPTEIGCYFVPTALLLAIASAWLDTLATESVADEPSPAEVRHEHLLNHEDPDA